jgi:tripeptide aminopeptidase
MAMLPGEPMSAVVERLLNLAARIQQVPAPTFREKKRALLVHDLFAAERLRDVTMDDYHNVYGCLAGRARSRPLIVTAHLDTVFPGRSSSLRREHDRIHGPGIGDNAVGVASLLALIWMLREAGTDLDSDLWLVANSCEEGLGDLRGMKAVVARFGANVRAYLVLEGTALGQVYHRAVGVRRYRVIVRTTGGHSWSDYGRPSAVHELASLITQLTALPLPINPRTTLNVGTIAGGSGVNVLASHAEFDLDVRSEGADSLSAVTAAVEERICSARREGVQVAMEVIGQRPAGEIPPDHPLVQLAVKCLEEEGLQASLTSGSTDANVPLSCGLPAIVLGITTGAGTHTRQEYIDVPPIDRGLRQLLRFVSRSTTDF